MDITLGSKVCQGVCLREWHSPLVAFQTSNPEIEIRQAEAEQRYGEAIYEPKSQRAERLRLAHLPGALLVEIPNNWSLCSSTQDCGRIEFLAKEVEAGSKKKPDTMIMASALETPAASYNTHQRTRDGIP